jgi:hypothetical protein
MSRRWLAVLALIASVGFGKAKEKGNPHANKSFGDDDHG